MNINSIKQYFEHWSETALDYILALDVSPHDVLHAEIREIRQELKELKQQFEARPDSQRKAA